MDHLLTLIAGFILGAGFVGLILHSRSSGHSDDEDEALSVAALEFVGDPEDPGQSLPPRAWLDGRRAVVQALTDPSWRQACQTWIDHWAGEIAREGRASEILAAHTTRKAA